MKSFMRKLSIGAAVGLSAAICAFSASASNLFFTTGGNTYDVGTVDIGPSTLGLDGFYDTTITVTLAPGITFSASNALGGQFAFNATGGVQLALDSVASSAGTGAASGFNSALVTPSSKGTFDYGLAYSGTPNWNGGQAGQPTSLTFVIDSTAALVITAFAAEIADFNFTRTATGAAYGDPTVTPIPGALALFAPVMGLGYLGFRRRKDESSATAA